MRGDSNWWRSVIGGIRNKWRSRIHFEHQNTFLRVGSISATEHGTKFVLHKYRPKYCQA